MKYSIIGMLVLGASVLAADLDFKCTYHGSAKDDEPYYGKNIKLAFKNKGGGEMIVKDTSGKEMDSGDLSPSSKKFKNPRYFGFDNFKDCAEKAWADVQAKMLKGTNGTVTFDGEGNEDCGIAEMKYDCKAE